MDEFAALLSTVIEALHSTAEPDFNTLAHVILTGQATDEHIALFTHYVCEGIDLNGGCIVEVMHDLAGVGVPHYILNGAIRTYVRLCDKREAEAELAAKEREEEAYKRMSGAPGYGA